MILRHYVVYLFFGVGVPILAGTHHILENKISENEKNLKQQTDFSDMEDEVIIRSLRAILNYEFKNYDFSLSGVRNLNDLLMESGGRPMRYIIISTWGSGTTFLEDILNALPGIYYSFEPLLYLRSPIRSQPEIIQVLNTIKNMLNCNYKRMDNYFEFGERHLLQFNHNKKLWFFCKQKSDLCYDPNFTSRVCKLFPFQLMKFVHLRLRVAHELLRDEQLNVKIILLIRDPRAVMLTRQKSNFCKKQSECSDPTVFCFDMIRDYVEAGYILKQFRHRLFVIRYEQLALEPFNTTRDLLKFLRLSASMSVLKFLETHTNMTSESNGFSSFRVFRDSPFKWKDKLNFTDVDKLQMACSAAMSLWGYEMAHNATHMASKEFNPLGNFTI